MSLKNHYYYDEELCEFIPVEYDRSKRMVHNLAIWIITGTIISGMAVALLSNFVGTPAELALKAENEVLVNQLEDTRSALVQLDEQLSLIAQNDNEVYRSILGLEEISYDERQAGTGGTDPYSDFDVHSANTSELLKWTASKVDNLERKISIQKLSFEEIKERYNENREKLKNLPAIKPTGGILLSGFGMRDHPILGYPRMHNGLDFRADIGDPVFATGDGVIKYAGRKSTFGRTVIIDHGFGYETLYAHLSRIPKEIRKGSKIKRGDQIGQAGTSGLTEGPHLHYEIHLNGNPVDPLYYLFADTSPEEYALFNEIARTNKKSLD